MRDDFWTKDDFDKLLKLWIDGKTTADIAIELGRTKQAVSTKGSRIGLFGKRPVNLPLRFSPNT